ncbi:MAG TPA: threonine--tRNA ligase [Solirubrobacteraceae bacterium]|nr:threonine--tRNA ligase [Solirubrobacteraceae bacterium]
MSITVHLPDGTALELAQGATGADAAAAIGAGLARAAIAVAVQRDGSEPQVVDLARPLESGVRIAILTAKSGPQALEVIRHDAAHVLATAMCELYPGVKLAIGPPIAEGFYYDFDLPEGVRLSDDDLPAIEERMRAHIAAAERFERSELSVSAARERFAAEGQDYKVELIDDIVRSAPAQAPVQTVSLYTNGPFTDLCRGPHAPDTSAIKAFRLQSVAGAYWRGDSKRPMLTRVYGTAFFSQKELEEHQARLEAARARDHRRLGRDLDLFLFSELSPGSPFWTPAGMTIFNELTSAWRALNSARGYHEVRTPILYDAELWRQSGHWEKYRENMYFTEVEGRQMGLKPMNCPAHIQIYKSARRSYRDLPIRYSEAGLVHRHEPSGVLHGLLRVRHITQDDAHIFCSEDQVQEEVRACLQFAFEIYELFDFDVRLELSTRPTQRIGSEEMWDRAEAALAGALDAQGLAYERNEGDGAFYGPKIDLHMEDAIGRSWQLGTIQLDYSMPERFDLRYNGADNAEHVPVMIHRALLGSFERFIGILLEHFAGELPLWLAPVQALIAPVSDPAAAYAQRVAERLRAGGVRCELDLRAESLGRKIRDAELRKIPYILVVGPKEAAASTVSARVRRRRKGAPPGEVEHHEQQTELDELCAELERERYPQSIRALRTPGGRLPTEALEQKLDIL